jgi:DNA (cytosine-5)-methyltransferase 1
MTGATLFSGIAAPEQAMPSWRWLWAAETAVFPSAVLHARHPETVNLGDVTAEDFCERARQIGVPDVLVFGSPCQGFSVAGKRLGLDDPRSNLALVALRIIGELKPAWFVFENVPGLLSNWSGGPESDAGWALGADGLDAGAAGDCHREFVESSDFAAFLWAVSELGAALAWAVLDAQYAGVAQRRERVFAVGHFGDWRGPAAVLLEPESLCGGAPPSRETREDVARPIGSGSPRGSGYRNDVDAAENLVAFGGNNQSGAIGVATAVNAGAMRRQDFETETFITHALRAEGFDASEDGTGRGTPIVSIAFSAKDHGADAGEIAPTLRSGNHDKSHANGGVMPAVAFNARQDPDAWEDRAGPLDTDGSTQAVSVPSAVRRLLPVECEKLQGFPPNYTAITYRGKPAKDGPRYQSLGNSMAVPVIRWILERIAFVHREKRERVA